MRGWQGRVFDAISLLFRSGCIAMVRGYQLTLGQFVPPCCRFTPSCSEYAILAFSKYGAAKGFLKACYRVMRCTPFTPGGYDPLK